MFQHKNHIPNTIKTNWTTEKFRSLFQKKKKKKKKLGKKKLENEKVKIIFKKKKKKNKKLGGKISAKPYCLTNTEIKSFKEARYTINIILKYVNVTHIAIT